MIDAATAMAHRRVNGYVETIRKTQRSDNADSPFLTHVVTKLAWSGSCDCTRADSTNIAFAASGDSHRIVRLFAVMVRMLLFLSGISPK